MRMLFVTPNHLEAQHGCGTLIKYISMFSEGNQCKSSQQQRGFFSLSIEGVFTILKCIEYRPDRDRSAADFH